MRRVSIKDVAREAGVSTATVSYVLNDTPRQSISGETAERVRAAVKKLDYVPNLNARSLSSRKTSLIGVVIPQTEPGREFMFSNPFYGDLLSSAEYAARQNGYHLLLSGSESGQSYAGIARNRGVDGIIIVGAYPTRFLDELQELAIPVVLVDTYVKHPAYHTIGIDDRLGGKMATDYLIGKGHRKIAFVAGQIEEHGVVQKRYQGYRDALEAAGIPYIQGQVYQGNISFDYAQAVAQEMLDRGQGETAAFASADILGMGLIKGLRRLKLRVPEDLSIVGFDDVYLARMCDPSLTTVRQDIAAKGIYAVQFILDALEGKTGKQERILPIDIVERESVRNI